MSYEKLSKNFSLHEMTYTSHIEYLARNQFEAKHPAIYHNLLRVTNELLQPLRGFFNAPADVHSGFRYTNLNDAIGGSEKSYHRFGAAADFSIRGVSLGEIFDQVLKMDLVFGELILEPSWIHITIPLPYRSFGKVLLAERDSSGDMIYRRYDEKSS